MLHPVSEHVRTLIHRYSFYYVPVPHILFLFSCDTWSISPFSLIFIFILYLPFQLWLSYGCKNLKLHIIANKDDFYWPVSTSRFLSDQLVYSSFLNHFKNPEYWWWNVGEVGERLVDFRVPWSVWHVETSSCSVSTGMRRVTERYVIREWGLLYLYLFDDPVFARGVSSISQNFERQCLDVALTVSWETPKVEIRRKRTTSKWNGLTHISDCIEDTSHLLRIALNCVENLGKAVGSEHIEPPTCRAQRLVSPSVDGFPQIGAHSDGNEVAEGTGGTCGRSIAEHRGTDPCEHPTGRAGWGVGGTASDLVVQGCFYHLAARVTRVRLKTHSFGSSWIRFHLFNCFDLNGVSKSTRERGLWEGISKVLGSLVHWISHEQLVPTTSCFQDLVLFRFWILLALNVCWRSQSRVLGISFGDYLRTNFFIFIGIFTDETFGGRGSAVEVVENDTCVSFWNEMLRIQEDCA